MKSVRVAAMAALVALAAGAVQAKPLPAEGMTPQEFAAFLQEQGYRANLKQDKDGKTFVESATGGVNFDVYFFDCKTRCAAIQIAAGWSMETVPTLEKVNGFNTSFRWLKANLFDDKSLWAEMDVTLGPGVTTEALEDHLGVWESGLENFKAHFDL